MKLHRIDSICDIEDVIDRADEEWEPDGDDEPLIITVVGCDGHITLEGPAFLFESLGIVAVEGTMWVKYEDGQMTPDFSLTVLYREDDWNGPHFNPNEYLYWEQDPILCALHNYLSFTGPDQMDKKD